MKRCSAFLLVLLLGSGVAGAAGKPRPPGQPKTGPGGADYAHAAVKETSLGTGDTQVWFFEPDRPAPKTAPVVVLLHGWGAMDPRAYRAWIDHLARRGNLVIYPRYQASFLTRPETMTSNAAAAIRAALAALRKPGHVSPDTSKLAAAGHSLGGVIAANFAAGAKALGVPQPQAVLSVEPGDSKGSHTARRLGRKLKSILTDYSTVPTGTLFVVVVGDEDVMVGARTAKKIWAGIGHLPKKDRDFLLVGSDRHGSPGLAAGHFFPAGASGLGGRLGVDALDYYGTWKLLDGLTDAAFHGKNRKYALGNTPEQQFMGEWSDGTPVKKLRALTQ